MSSRLVILNGLSSPPSLLLQPTVYWQMSDPHRKRKIFYVLVQCS